MDFGKRFTKKNLTKVIHYDIIDLERENQMKILKWVILPSVIFFWTFVIAHYEIETAVLRYKKELKQ
jgi:hypothetical protein